MLPPQPPPEEPRKLGAAKSGRLCLSNRRWEALTGPRA
jgi:hypothetical protein